jgi:hypothetical protein
MTRPLLLLCCLALVLQCALVASAAGFAAFADAALRPWSPDTDVTTRWHEPVRYLTLASRLDPMTGAYPETRGQIAQLVAERSPDQRAAQQELARRALAAALECSPRDGILWARQAVLLIALDDERGASAALEQVLVWAPFEPPAHRLVLTAAAAHWIRLDAVSRTRVLGLAGNALMQAEQGVPEHAAAAVEGNGLLPLACHDLERRGNVPRACLARRGITGAD